MLTALKDQISINILDKKYNREQLKYFSNENMLKCPACGGSYEYCHGEFILPYFRHKEKDCLLQYAESESEEHYLGKINLYNWIRSQSDVKNVHLEYWIPETKQRPDIYFEKDNKKYVIEYQCTPIASEFLIRSNLYQLNGIEDIWIMGAQKYGVKIVGNYPNNFIGRKVIEKYSKLYLTSEKQIAFKTEEMIHKLTKGQKEVVGYCTYANLDDFIFTDKIELSDICVQTFIKKAKKEMRDRNNYRNNLYK